MIDSHCHFDATAFELQQSDIWKACLANQLTHLIIPSVRADKNTKAIELTERLSGVYFASGLHPAFIDAFFTEHKSHASQHLSELISAQVAHRNCVAIGEIGLDTAINCPLALQLECLQCQIQLADELNIPIILHHRKSHHLLLPLLKKQGLSAGGVIHGFSGSLQQAQEYWSLGFYLGIGGVISYERAKKTRSALALMPLESIVLETDAPFMPVSGFQGQINFPYRLGLIAQHLSELKSLSVDEIIHQTSVNTHRLFPGLKNDSQ